MAAARLCAALVVLSLAGAAAAFEADGDWTQPLFQPTLQPGRPVVKIGRHLLSHPQPMRRLFAYNPSPLLPYASPIVLSPLPYGSPAVFPSPAYGPSPTLPYGRSPQPYASPSPVFAYASPSPYKPLVPLFGARR